MTSTHDDERPAPTGARRREIEERVHVDLPRVRPEEMTTAQPVTPARDPQGGRDTEQEFLLRNAGF